MASAIQRALENLANAQSMPLAPPSGTKECPDGRCRIGVFFDGTGNNKWRDWGNGASNRKLDFEATDFLNDTERQKPNGKGKRVGMNGPTNVAKLFECYKPSDIPKLHKVYHHGVGSDFDYDDKTAKDTPGGVTKRYGNGMAGGGLGFGGKERIRWGLNQLAEFYTRHGNLIVPHKLFDVFGFSRGAALARDFVNEVKTTGVRNLEVPVKTEYIRVPSPRGGTVLVPREVFERIPDNQITPKFMGVFDTVNMFNTGDSFLLQVDHSYVEYCVHLVAEDEFRMLFPLTSIFMDPNDQDSWFKSTRNKYQKPIRYKKWMLELWYPGCHSDVGGSYLDRADKPPVPAQTIRQVDEFGFPYEYTIPAKPAVPGKKKELAHIPLLDMHTACKKALVPMDPLSKLPAHMYVIPDRLGQIYAQYVAYRKGTDYAQITEKADARYIHAYEDSEFRRRFYTETRYKDFLQPWNWHRDDPKARESQPFMQELQRDYIHDSSAEFALTGWAEKNIVQTRLQRSIVYADAQPSVGAPGKIGNEAGVRDYNLPKD
ncbi:T6SS phospholipase effector Tle1-like catalytic domain-containing protein [Polyangium fumosum]|uniref:DUF2235 domain-containing protein n=1 Tax=Polyangium fumosum TaxID=889272 RepID=A0A4V5PML7_9BACT|nr:DUF2235 domain-containing protein [Polyangium fumosum]TKD04489.1 DUF2235 domain-containing protein [Polyangium fumosum]